MNTPQRFALIVPTLNEAGNIKAVLDRATYALASAPLAWEILVVDDESVDGTTEIVSEFAHTDSRVRLISRRGQSGLAGAMTYGWAQTTPISSG